MIGHIGVVVGLALLILLALRGMNIFIASLVSTIVVAVTNGLHVAETISGSYSETMFGFAQMFFLLFLTGAVFGRVMGSSLAALSIANALTRLLGLHRSLLVIVLANALLTYGGVNVFIVAFTMYPLGLGLLQRANVPKRLFAAAGCLGGGTFTMTAMPGSPSIHNNIPAGFLGTPLSAGWGLGLIASALMFGLGMAYLEYERRKAKRAGEGFVPHPQDPLPKEENGTVVTPHWLPAAIPLAVVIATILLPQWLIYWITPPESPSNLAGQIKTFIWFSQTHPLLWTSFALALGTITALLLLRRYITLPSRILSHGAEDAALPLLNTAAVIGFGGVVKATPIFDAFESIMVESGINPILSMVMSVNVVSGIVGSASGGLGIFMETLAPHYLEIGVSAETMHRLAAIASGGLDSLPHCGAIITFLTVMRLTHKEAYKEVAIVTILVPLIALAIVTAIAILSA